MSDKQIVINARFLTRSITGVERYAIEISKRLKNLNADISFVAPKNLLHTDVALELGVKIIGRGTGYYWEQVELVKYLKTLGNPLLFCPCNMAPIWYTNKITTVHDIAFKKFSKNFDWKFRLIYSLLMPLVIKSSKRIITVSQFSKHEILNYYKLQQNHIDVIYNGVDKSFIKKEKKIKDRYILCVGSLDPRKNFTTVMNAFLQAKIHNCQLFIVGKENKNFKQVDLINMQNIKFLGYVSDEELIQYYSDALLFIYPSLYEGFGFPPLEAMACGTPVITSKITSMPEVCGDAALYIDPYDPQDLIEKMNLVLSDMQIQYNMISKGLQQAKKFTWEIAAKKYMSIFEKVLQ